MESFPILKTDVAVQLLSIAFHLFQLVISAAQHTAFHYLLRLLCVILLVVYNGLLNFPAIGGYILEHKALVGSHAVRFQDTAVQFYPGHVLLLAILAE